ncbi:MAG: VWA domain-containing protein [bacterium]
MRWANINLIYYLLAGVLLYLALAIFRDIKFGKFKISNLVMFAKKTTSGKNILMFIPDVLKIIGVILLVIAVLRPQEVKTETKESMKGIDIIMALDVSGSMQAQDLQPNRLEAAKEVCRNFVNGLKSDRVGLIVFAGKSFTQCPLTADYEIVRSFIDQIDIGTVRVNGTAVGEAILNAVNRLEKSGPSKVIILTTDGRSNTGMDTLQAAKLAGYKGIKIYTIGIGQKGGAPMLGTDAYGRRGQIMDQFGRPAKWEEPDEATLTQAAQLTGGRYFRATNKESLAQIYATINQLEKQKIDVKAYNKYNEKFEIFLWLGFLCLVVALVLEIFVWVRVLV